MSYIDGFVIAVPNNNRQKFIDHARSSDSVFMELGATRVLECWGDDVKDGKLTDFRRAVQAKQDEAVVFSWIEWPDKPTRDKAMKRMDELMQSDDRMNPGKNPMPFDGKRMIFGGFASIVDQRTEGRTGYVDGALMPVPVASKDRFLDFAAEQAAIFLAHGAVRVVDGWGDDIPDGKLTDHRRAVQATDDETVVFAWIEWPSKEVRDQAWAKVMADSPQTAMPFDARRMVLGGFAPIPLV